MLLPCAAIRTALPSFSIIPTHLRSCRFRAGCSCSSRSNTFGAPSGRTGVHFPKIPTPVGWGTRLAKWEGDTFVVETIGFNDKQWVDPYGDPRSEQTHLTERYRRLNYDTLELQITIDDPKSYTKVWVSPPKLHKLEPTWEIAEWFCVIDEDKAYDEVVRKPAGVAPSPR